MTGQLEHPNIVPVHELAMCANGRPLLHDEARARRRASTTGCAIRFDAPGSTERLEEGLEIFLKVCDAVAYAHHRGVIHRDLKPENIMVAALRAGLPDGLGARAADQDAPASGSRSQMEAPGPVGTPHFMAPEQARGNPADMDERSDVFGLGAVLYEIVSGRSPTATIESHDERFSTAHGWPGHLHRRGHPEISACPRRIRAIVDKACAPNPDDRYQTRRRAAASDARDSCAAGSTFPAAPSRRARSSSARATWATRRT